MSAARTSRKRRLKVPRLRHKICILQSFCWTSKFQYANIFLLKIESRSCFFLTVRALLSTYDAALVEVRRDSLQVAEITLLDDTAMAVMADVERWRAFIDRLDRAASGRFNSRRAGQLILENVFDDVLIPSAWRLLAASLALARGLA